MKKKIIRKQNNSTRCFICGLDNDKGLRAEFYELEDGTLAATAVAHALHQSYPGRVHGGVTHSASRRNNRACNQYHGT